MTELRLENIERIEKYVGEQGMILDIYLNNGPVSRSAMASHMFYASVFQLSHDDEAAPTGRHNSTCYSTCKR